MKQQKPSSEIIRPPFVIEMLCVPVSEFRANISQLIEGLGRSHNEISLTKNGKPVARILPPAAPLSMLGTLKDSVAVPDDFDIDNLIAIDPDWEDHMVASWERSANYNKHQNERAAPDSSTSA